MISSQNMLDFPFLGKNRNKLFNTLYILIKFGG